VQAGGAAAASCPPVCFAKIRGKGGDRVRMRGNGGPVCFEDMAKGAGSFFSREGAATGEKGHGSLCPAAPRRRKSKWRGRWPREG
jgi:hypothetical protein